jgi:hypothetical protein
LSDSLEPSNWIALVDPADDAVDDVILTREQWANNVLLLPRS